MKAFDVPVGIWLLVAVFVLTVTAAISQEPVPGYTVTAATAEGKVVVTWTAPAGRPGSDWIGLAVQGSAPGAYLDWLYTNGTRTAGTSGPATGSVTLTLPAQQGIYEARYYNSADAASIAATAEFAVGDIPPPVPIPPATNFRVITRVTIHRADDTIEVRAAEETVNTENPGEAALSMVQSELAAGDTATVDEWFEPITAPERPSDRQWSLKVNRLR